MVAKDKADVVLDPVPYVPRKNKRKVGRMLGEHARRVGDPNLGGQAMRAPLMTAYRQEALRCAELLASNGPDEGGGAARGLRSAQSRPRSCNRMSMAGSSASSAASMRSRRRGAKVWSGSTASRPEC